jgi:hypothetical protein
MNPAHVWCAEQACEGNVSRAEVRVDQVKQIRCGLPERCQARWKTERKYSGRCRSSAGQATAGDKVVADLFMAYLLQLCESDAVCIAARSLARGLFARQHVESSMVPPALFFCNAHAHAQACGKHGRRVIGASYHPAR